MRILKETDAEKQERIPSIGAPSATLIFDIVKIKPAHTCQFDNWFVRAVSFFEIRRPSSSR